MKSFFSYSLFFLFLLFYAPAVAQTVSLQKNVFAPGEKIVVSFSGFLGTPKDWISIAEPGSADEKYIIWGYTDGSKSGTITFDGRNSGDYEIRGYFNNESIIRARVSFRVGNTDRNLVAKPTQASYKPFEKITVQFSGLPGNSRDWISIASVGSAIDQYKSWFYTEGKQSGTHEFPGQPEGDYEVRVYFYGSSIINYRYPFSVGKAAAQKLCRTELSAFYAGMNQLGLTWGRLGSDAITPVVIAEVQSAINNAIIGMNAVACARLNTTRLSDFSSRLPSLTRQQSVDEIDAIIKSIQGELAAANITCDRNGTLMALFVGGIHLGAAQAIANSFICRMIAPDWQMNIRNHMTTAQTALFGFRDCIPSVDLPRFGNVPVGAGNAYEPLSVIIGLHTQVLWAVSLSECCCYCK